MAKGQQLYPCVENELEIMEVKFKIFNEAKEKRMWEAIKDDVKENYTEPLHMSVRMTGGAGSILAGKSGEEPEGFTWKVRRISQRQPDRRKRVEKWTGLRLKKTKKKEKEPEVYGEPGEESEEEEKKKKRCKKPSEWKKSRCVLGMRGFFGCRKPGDYDQMSLLKDPTTFKYMQDLEDAGLATDLTKKPKGPQGKGTVMEPEEGQIKGREMMGKDGQIWPYGGMGAPWYEGPLCHPECICLLRGWEDPATMSQAYKLIKKLHDSTGRSPRDLPDSYLDLASMPQGSTHGPPGSLEGAVSKRRCWEDEIETCANSKAQQLRILQEIGDEIYKMMPSPKQSKGSRRSGSSESSRSSEEGNFTYEDFLRDDCACGAGGQGLKQRSSEKGKRKRKSEKCRKEGKKICRG